MRRNQTEDEIVLQDMETEHAGIIHETQQLKEQLADFNHFIASHYQNILQAVSNFVILFYHFIHWYPFGYLHLYIFIVFGIISDGNDNVFWT